MSQTDNIVSPAARHRGGVPISALVPTFVLSIFLSALLLFSVQPMFAKMTLPLLGGVSNVWNTAMVFFQATLLAGYIYAHYLSKHAPLKIQLIVHCAVLLLGVLFLPLAIAKGWAPPSEGAPALWLIMLYGASIGAPFFALSATAPLLQRWFSYTRNAHAGDPYFLYAASNLGSLLSLLAYPVLIEPLIGVRAQSQIWSFGYIGLLIAIAGAGIVALGNRSKPSSGIAPTPTRAIANSSAPVSTNISRQRALWVSLAFVPSSLMLGVTTYFSVNIATAPFIWIAPLALYLLTFVFAFMQTPILRQSAWAMLLPFGLVVAGMISLVHNLSFFVAFGAHLSIFFLVAMYFHGRLATLRPDVSRLTEFYICMSVGGVLGGVFNALIAPQIFNNVYEYGLVIAIAGLAVGSIWPTRKTVWVELGFVLAMIAILSVVVYLANALPPALSFLQFAGLCIVFLAIYTQKARPVRFAGGLLAMQIALMFAAPHAPGQSFVSTVFEDRSFFGVTRVVAKQSDGDVIHTLIHGNTIHNIQRRAPDRRNEMLAYYYQGGPWNEVIDAARQPSSPSLNVAIVGLGAGALACYREPGDQFTFYEIDPAMVRMATNPQNFTYLADCAPQAPIIVGDARLQLVKAADHSIDLLMIDAFSSDAIPAHLVTREALALYRSKVSEDGLIFFHTSNRFADVSSVVIALANDAGLSARAYGANDFKVAMDDPLKAIGEGVIVGRADVIASAFGSNERWHVREPHRAVGIWTDDYSHIIGAIIANQSK